MRHLKKPDLKPYSKIHFFACSNELQLTNYRNVDIARSLFLLKFYEKGAMHPFVHISLTIATKENVE